jgi:hypothetical protein
MHFLVTMQASINPPGRMSIDGLPPFVDVATFTFVINAKDFESAFELAGDLAELCPYTTTVEIKQAGALGE